MQLVAVGVINVIDILKNLNYSMIFLKLIQIVFFINSNILKYHKTCLTWTRWSNWDIYFPANNVPIWLAFLIFNSFTVLVKFSLLLLLIFFFMCFITCLFIPHFTDIYKPKMTNSMPKQCPECQENGITSKVPSYDHLFAIFNLYLVFLDMQRLLKYKILAPTSLKASRGT